MSSEIASWAGPVETGARAGILADQVTKALPAARRLAAPEVARTAVAGPLRGRSTWYRGRRTG